MAQRSVAAAKRRRAHQQTDLSGVELSTPETGIAVSAPPGPPQRDVTAHMTVNGWLAGSPAFPIRKGQQTLCRWIDDERIPVHVRAYAQEQAEAAGRLLGLRPVRIRWFELVDRGAGDFSVVATRDNEITGGVSPVDDSSVLGLLAGMQGPILRAVIYHERRHNWQAYLMRALQDEDWVERDAAMFATECMEAS